MNIGILGIGGVGGYFGGKLAEHYRHSEQVKIIFIARPSTAAVIRNEGLKLLSPQGENIIHPYKTATDAQDAGPLDLLICATKSYDLEKALSPLAACITGDTLILPLLNGVNARDIILNVYPAANVLDGCVYVNAKRLAPGVVQKAGGIEKLYFGSAFVSGEKLKVLQQIFLAAGIDSYLSDNIETDIWAKFVFTAGMATSTSYFDESLGEVLKNAQHRETLTALIREATAVAVAKGISLPGDIVAKSLEKMEGMPFDATSSMHRDFRQGGQTEYRSLTTYIAVLGDELSIATPTFDVIVADFIQRERMRITP